MSATQSTGAGTPDTAAATPDTAGATPDTAAGPPGTQDYAGELGGFVLARSAVDRVSARRADTDWLAAAWADPATRVLILENARALVRFGDKEAELVLVPPAEAPEGLRFLLGVDDADVPYFGVMGPPGSLASLTATETAADPSITGEAEDAAPPPAAEAPAEDGPEQEAPGESAGGTEAEAPAAEAAPDEVAPGETADRGDRGRGDGGRGDGAWRGGGRGDGAWRGGAWRGGRRGGNRRGCSRAADRDRAGRVAGPGQAGPAPR